MEPVIKTQVSPELHREHLELMEIALDVEKISNVLERMREASS